MVAYLVILILYFFDFFGLMPFLPEDGNMILASLLGYIVLGYIIFKNKRHTIKTKGIYTPLVFIAVGIVLSMIPAELYYHQPYIVSLQTYKVQYLWITIPVLFYIAPTEEELFQALKVFFFLMVLDYIGKLVAPGVFLTKDDLENIARGETSITVAGYPLATILFFKYLQDFRISVTRKKILVLLGLITFIFLMQSRSTLFPMLLFFAYSVYTNKSRYRFFLILAIGVLCVFMFAKTAETWISLFTETTSQLGDEDYARNISMVYYLTEASPNWVCKVFGNGFISLRTSSSFLDLLEMQITNSDVGFVGYWNQYGIIPVLSFIYVCVLAIRNNAVPYYVKLWAWQILICSVTVSYFGSQYHMIYFILFYYLTYYNISRQKHKSYYRKTKSKKLVLL